MSADRLSEAEATWSPARDELAAVVERAGGHLENGHWDWRHKMPRVEARQLLRIGVECEGQVQGLLALAAKPRPAVLTNGGEVVYVDYL